MAYTITQKPTTPNAAYTRLMYVVSGSTNTAKPQFQYVMDVYQSGSNDLIKRTFSGINPAGVSVFDPARIIQGELSQDDSWKISSLTAFNSSSKTFTLNFGETYAASISSSAVIIEGISNTNIEVFRGVVEPNNGISYNWQSSSYAVLSNMPTTMSMQSDDYGTIGVYNNDVSYVSQSFYNSVNVLSATKNYSITDNFSSVPISSSVSGWKYAEVNVSSSIGLQSYRYEVSDETHREKVRFAFINKLGTWDYYNNYNPVKQLINVEREQYTAARVDYSSLTSTYDISRRGLKDYHNSTDDIFTVDTDLLNKTNANWLEELIESPSVYIQRNGEFIPIVITDSSYTANTNQARQKQFQYTINFKPSNQPFGTWIPEFIECPPTPLFDPSLGGRLPLFVWFDFTDSSTMDIYDTDKVRSVTNKGSWPLTIASMSGANADSYSAPVWDDEYITFTGDIAGGKNSHLGSYNSIQGTGVGEAEIPIMQPTSSFTIMTFYRSRFTMNQASGSGANAYSLASYESPGGNTINEVEIVQLVNAVDQINSNQEYFSNTVPPNSGSISGSAFKGNLTGSSAQHALFSYSGSSTEPWSSQVVIQNFDAGIVEVFRTPDKKVTYNDTFDGPPNFGGAYLTLGAEANVSVKVGPNSDMSQFIIYPTVLSDSQVNQVIANFSGSVSFGNELNRISN